MANTKKPEVMTSVAVESVTDPRIDPCAFCGVYLDVERQLSYAAKHADAKAGGNPAPI